MKKNEGFIYFVQEGDLGAIKIGFAKDVKSRISSLQTGNSSELILIGMIHGNVWLERKLHKQFKDCRKRGEWFHPTSQLLSYIDGLSKHPKDNRVYFPIGSEVLRGDLQGVVTGLNLKTYDYEVGYNVKLENGREISNAGYAELRTIENRDHDPEVGYHVNPSDQEWREEQILKLNGKDKGRFTLSEFLNLNPDDWNDYACLIDKNVA